MPKFSILMLTWNRVEAVKKCIESLEPTLGGYDCELLILDNGSDDGTAQFVQHLPFVVRGGEVRVWLESKNLGVAAGRQKLLKQAKGEIVIFLDSDVQIKDLLWLAHLETPLLEENIGVAGPGGANLYFGEGIQISEAQVGECDVVSGWCLAVKKECIQAGAKFDLEYGIFYEEDSDFCLQVRALGWDVVNTGDIGVAHTAGSSGAHLVDRYRNLLRLREKWSGKGLIKTEAGY